MLNHYCHCHPICCLILNVRCPLITSSISKPYAGYRSVPTASAPPSRNAAPSSGRSNHPELYAGAYSGTGGGGRGTAYEMRHHNKV